MMALAGSILRKYTTAFTFTETLSRRITSCFGTSSTMTRRSTLIMRWIMGHSRIRPGPLMPVKRPSVNVTPRSYSFSTRTALKIRMATRTTTTSPKLMQLSSYRFDPQQQTFDARDAHERAFAQRHARQRVPQLAAEAHDAAAVEILEHFRGGADHRLRTRDDGALHRAARHVGDADDDQATDGGNGSD